MKFEAKVRKEQENASIQCLLKSAFRCWQNKADEALPSLETLSVSRSGKRDRKTGAKFRHLRSRVENTDNGLLTLDSEMVFNSYHSYKGISISVHRKTTTDMPRESECFTYFSGNQCSNSHLLYPSVHSKNNSLSLKVLSR